MPLVPTFDRLRRNKFAMTHNWSLTIAPSMFANPLFAPLTSFVQQLIEGWAGGGVALNCTSASVPRSRVKIVRDVIHGQSVQQVVGREPTAGEITLEFLDAHDLRVFKFFEIWKQLLADKFSGNPTEITIPFIRRVFDVRSFDGVVLTLFDDNRWQPRTQYRLLDACCVDVNHNTLGSDENFIRTTATIAYLNYDLIDIGLIGAVNLIPGVDLLGRSSSTKYATKNFLARQTGV